MKSPIILNILSGYYYGYMYGYDNGFDWLTLQWINTNIKKKFLGMVSSHIVTSLAPAMSTRLCSRF